VCLSVKDFHKFDRTFSAGSLLGVPATYTGHTYTQIERFLDLKALGLAGTKSTSQSWSTGRRSL
jgi:hypothetical protein